MTNVLKIGAVLSLAVVFAACNQTPQGNSVPSTAETDAVSASINDEVMASTSTLTLENGLQALSLSNSARVQAGGGCITVNPNPVVDTDSDGVPDSATYTFDCSSDRPLYAFSTKGTLQVSDPSSDAGTWGFDSQSDLTHTTTNKLRGITVTEARKGSRSPRKTGDQVSQSHNITVTRTVNTDPSATITNLWNLTFSATTPGSITMGSPLPAGSIVIAGNYGFSKNGMNRTWTLSTTAPLQYDPSCDNPLMIVGGTLRATLSGPNGNGFLEVMYGACGTEPVVTRNFTPAA
jgi:hypothetical protein